MDVRRVLLGVVATAQLFVAGAAAGAEGQEPKIKGKPLSRWVRQLTGPNRGLQVRAARALREAPEKARPEIIQTLIPILQSKRQNDRFVAAQVLGDYGSAAESAVPGLLPVLKGTQFERNRAAAAKALGKILKDAKPSPEVESIAKALSAKYNEEYDKYSDVRREAVRAVGMIGPAAKAVIPDLARALIDFKKHSDEHKRVRQQAAWACGRMGPLAKDHIDRLISMLHAEGHELPEIVWAIGEIGPVHENVIPNIVDFLEKTGRGWRNDPKSKMNGWVALEAFGPKSAPAVPLIARYLREGIGTAEPPAIFIQWFKVLRAIGPKAREALPGLTKWAGVTQAPRGWTKDKLAEVRKAAAETMEGLK